MANALEASGQYRVLRRFVPSASYQLDLDAELLRLATDIYPRAASVTVDVLTGYERFTARYHARDKRPLPARET